MLDSSVETGDTRSVECMDSVESTTLPKQTVEITKNNLLSKMVDLNETATQLMNIDHYKDALEHLLQAEVLIKSLSKY